MFNLFELFLFFKEEDKLPLRLLSDFEKSFLYYPGWLAFVEISSY